MNTSEPKEPRKGSCGSFGGRNKAGKPCGQPAIAGTERCVLHAGKPTAVAKAQGSLKLAVQAWNPETLPPVSDVTAEAIRLITVTKRMHADYLAALSSEVMSKDMAALVGVAYSEHGKSGEYITGLAQLEAIERDRLWRFLKDYRQAGYDERRLELAEKQLDLLDGVLRAAVSRLGAMFGFTVDDPRVVDAVVTSMREIEGG